MLPDEEFTSGRPVGVRGPVSIEQAEPAGSASPRRSLPRWGATGLLVFLPVLLFLFFALHERGWDGFGIFHLRPYFADTVAILAAGQARQAGLDVYAPNPIDPYGRRHVYGPWWLVTGRLGLKTTDALWLGPLLDLAFLIVAAAVLARAELRATAMAAAFMISPPVLLGLERANNDLVVFLLFAAATWLLSHRRWRLPAVGMGVLVAAAALKMYPLAAFPALGVKAKSRAGRLMIGTALLACAAIGWWEWPEFRQAFRLAPRPVSVFAFGLATSVATWRNLADTHLWFTAGVVLASLLAIGPWLRHRKDCFDSVPAAGSAALFFVAAALAWAACLCCATNYGYRLVLILAPVAVWLSQVDDSRFGRVARIQIAGWLVVFWLMCLKGWLVDAAIGRSSIAMKTLSLVVGFEQMLVLLLTIALGIAVTGWLWRTLRGSDEVTCP